MKESDIQLITDCLPKGKTHFYYYKDRYAQMLLSYCIGAGLSIGQLKKTIYRKLLNNKLIKKLVQDAGSDTLTPIRLESVWPSQYECYLLTLGKWGSKNSKGCWYQTSRKGFNLVLQLNFSGKHNHPYQKLIQPDDDHPYECDIHPIAEEGYHTLAWSRMDIDLDSGQALIEEIQNDWIRNALSSRRFAEYLLREGKRSIRAIEHFRRYYNCSAANIIRYVDHILSAHIRIWDEAMLAATIWFLREEIGIRNIYFHSFKTGNKLKDMRSYSLPPRSVYTQLPRQFCFVKTQTGPDWFYQEKRSRKKFLKAIEPLEFWRLVL